MYNKCKRNVPRVYLTVYSVRYSTSTQIFFLTSPLSNVKYGFINISDRIIHTINYILHIMFIERLLTTCDFLREVIPQLLSNVHIFKHLQHMSEQICSTNVMGLRKVSEQITWQYRLSWKKVPNRSWLISQYKCLLFSL